MTKYLYYGPQLNERDGGAILNYYLLRKLNQLRPMDEYYAVPKVPEELDASYLPWVNFVESGDPVSRIPSVMLGAEIPVVNTFHIGRDELEKIITPVHNIGGKIVCHQTLHWPDDDIFKCQRLHEFDKIVAPLQYAKLLFQRVGRVPEGKIEVIPHGVPTELFNKRPTILERRLGVDKKRQKVILYSGRLSYWKGVAQIIPIMRQLCKEFGCVFIIRGSAFGGIEESERLAYIFERLSTNNPYIFFFPDWQPPSFMEELYAMTDILLFNSAHEGFGIPLLEIQAVGGVPVATAIPPHVEIMGRTGEVGMLLEPRVEVGTVNDGRKLMVANSDQLYGATKWLLENPDEASIMGLRGIKNVKQRFELTSVAGQWLKMYDNLIYGQSMEDTVEKQVMYEE